MKSIKELLALAKRGKLNPGNNGAGTTSHLSVEMLNQYAGLNLPMYFRKEVEKYAKVIKARNIKID